MMKFKFILPLLLLLSLNVKGATGCLVGNEIYTTTNFFGFYNTSPFYTVDNTSPYDIPGDVNGSTMSLDGPNTCLLANFTLGTKVYSYTIIPANLPLDDIAPFLLLVLGAMGYYSLSKRAGFQQF